MHWEIGQVVLQVTPFAKSELVRLEAEVMYSEHICSGKRCSHWRAVADLEF